MNDEKGPAVPWAAIAAVGAILSVGALFYAYLALNWKSDTAPTWGALGDAVGPFVAVLNVVALFAALWSVALQRHELELQRRELRETREEMKEQRAQFERTAIAQEALAASQERLANAQERANEVGLQAIVATYQTSIASTISSLAELDALRVGRMAAYTVDKNRELERQAGARISRTGVMNALAELRQSLQRARPESWAPETFDSGGE